LCYKQAAPTALKDRGKDSILDKALPIIPHPASSIQISASRIPYSTEEVLRTLPGVIFLPTDELPG